MLLSDIFIYLLPAAVLMGIFVNGATDAPGSVTGVVASGGLSFRRAALLCAVFNFLGMFLSYRFMPGVAETVSSLADFGDRAGIAVAASMLSVVTFASAAWYFGIPTSESHAMLAAIAGAGICTGSEPGYISAFLIILLKSALSCVSGFLAGGAVMLLMRGFGKRKGHPEARRSLQVQITVCAASSAVHGMQDGQKFLSLLAAAGAAVGIKTGSTAAVFVCCLVMALGCFTGGRRIVEKLGYEMTGGIDREEGLASDIGALSMTLLSSLLAIPVSTTYMKTCSMLGTAAVSGKRADRRTSLSFVLAWVATYPVCMLLSWIFFRLIEFVAY